MVVQEEEILDQEELVEMDNQKVVKCSYNLVQDFEQVSQEVAHKK